MPVGKRITPISSMGDNEKPQRSQLWGFSIPNFVAGRIKPAG